MIITIPGKDIIVIDETNLSTLEVNKTKKIHIIRLNFLSPDEDKMNWVLDNFPLTNRFVINDNIKFYNWFFKSNNKKYYVENGYNIGIFTFFKKNNKILLNVNRLKFDIQKIILKNNIFKDILKNLEIIEMDKKTFEEKEDVLLNWTGNVIISDGKN